MKLKWSGDVNILRPELTTPSLQVELTAVASHVSWRLKLAFRFKIAFALLLRRRQSVRPLFLQHHVKRVGVLGNGQK